MQRIVANGAENRADGRGDDSPPDDNADEVAGREEPVELEGRIGSSRPGKADRLAECGGNSGAVDGGGQAVDETQAVERNQRLILGIGQVRPPRHWPEAEQLLQTANKNKALSFIGFAGGLAAAGISAALFAF